MRLETIAAGGVLIALAATPFLIAWLQADDPAREADVEARGGQQPASAPPLAAPPPRTVSVLFEFDSASLREAEAAKLDAWLRAAHRSGFKRVDAVGHAGRVGRAGYNVRLSGRRAAAVKAYLAGHHLDPQRVRTRAKGEAAPVTREACRGMGPETGANALLIACLQPDRRVEVTVS